METAKSLIYIFSGLGILDTSYLIYHKLRGTDVACPFFPKEWCHKVQHAKQSKMFGIPVSMLGFAMYVALIAMMWLAQDGAIPYWWLRVVITFGFLFSMYFTYVQAFVLRAFCTWCVVSAINFSVMFVASFWLA